MDLPECPFCGTLDGCPHLLLEWWISPAEVVRGSLAELTARLESVSGRLLEECCRARQPPRQSGLMRAYVDGLGVLEEHSVDSGELLDHLDFLPVVFAVDCVARAPGVSKVEIEVPPRAGAGGDHYVSFWAREPEQVRGSLLDVLASLEVQLDQFFYERGERPPTV